MGKKNSANSFVMILALVAIILIAGTILISRRNVVMMPTSVTTNTPLPVTSTNSNSDLQQDMTTIDSSLNSDSASQNSVNQGVNDTPIAQPNY